jgi:predicted nucleotidyltransferase
MTAAVKSELDRIVNTLVETGIVTKIILFGSHARGDGTPDSDIDLCVLTSVEDRHPIDLIVDFRKKLRGVRTMPLDLLAYNKENFYYHAKRPTSFEYEIVENGISLYGQR